MKFRIHMKDPDGVYESVEDAAKLSAAAVDGIDADEMSDLVDSRREKISKWIERWFRYGEYVTIEVDTEAGTATVVEAK